MHVRDSRQVSPLQPAPALAATKQTAAMLEAKPRPGCAGAPSLPRWWQLPNFPRSRPAPIAHFCLPGICYYYLGVSQTPHMPLAPSQKQLNKAADGAQGARGSAGELPRIWSCCAGGPRHRPGRASPRRFSCLCRAAQLAEHPLKRRSAKHRHPPAATALAGPSARGRRVLPSSGRSPQKRCGFHRSHPALSVLPQPRTSAQEGRTAPRPPLRAQTLP